MQKKTNPIEKVISAYIHHPTGIHGHVNERTGRLTFLTGGMIHSGQAEFVFKDSKPDTVIKVANALLALCKLVPPKITDESKN